MNVNRNIKVVSLIFLCTYAAVCFRYAQLQVLQKEEWEQKKFVRREHQEKIEKYLAAGGVSKRGGKMAIVPAKVLPPDVPIMASLLDSGLVRETKNGIVVDANAFAVSNPRQFHARETAIRGSIRDREGELLAWSSFERSWQVRHYSNASLWFHTVGYIHPVFGKSGIEKFADSLLKGSQEGLMQVLFRLDPSRQGSSDIATTLDSSLQEFAATEMNGHKGAALVIAPKTGEILACVSSPLFNPEAPDRIWNTEARKDDSAMLNRCWDTVYPPGSTFKILVAAAALEEGIISQDDTFECDGFFHPIAGARYAIHDFEWSHKNNWRGHNPGGLGWWTIEDAFIHSCNSTFAQVGTMLGNECLFRQAERFGFFNPIPIRLTDADTVFSSKPSTIFHDVSDPALLPPQRFTRGALAQTAIGQYETRATPLQMGLVACAVANDGIIMNPTLLREERNVEGKTISAVEPSPIAKPISRETAATLRDFMRKAAAYGTGKQAYRECPSIAGKTGTAQVPGKKAHSWFVGFAPYDAPQVVIVVIIENGGTGGSVAAPIAGRILQKYIETHAETEEVT